METQAKEKKAEKASPSIQETTLDRVMREKKENSRMVRARFISLNGNQPKIGPFPLRLYPGRIETYTFEHGKEYTVPIWVMNHMNKVGTEKYEPVLDQYGKPIKKDEKETRFQFSVIEYL